MTPDHLEGRPAVDTVTVLAYDDSLHTGASRAGQCGQGGQDTCSQRPVFSVVGPRYRVAACDTHLSGAVRQAAGLPRRR